MSLFKMAAFNKRITLVVVVLIIHQVATGYHYKLPAKNEVSWMHWLLDANPEYDARNTNISLYQATQSITFQPGFETPDGDEFTAEILATVSQVPAPSSNTGSANNDMNWVLTKNFDENGNVVGETKRFYDNGGRPLQMQNKIKYRKDAATTYTHVFASQAIRDVLGREALNTIAAPIDNSEFMYKPDFVRDGSGGNYNYRNFDRSGPLNAETDKTNNPDPIGAQHVPGTLGWYYSANNTWEPYTATTNYPFTRQVFYRDGTGNVKKSAGAGEVFRAGSGHEVSNYITPVVNELDHYIQVRNKFFPSTDIGAAPATLRSEAMQSISSDANGRIGVAIQDKSRQTLLAARPGTDLTVSNTATVGAGNVFYFRTFATGNISISAATNQFYNMGTQAEDPVNIGTGGSVAAGYYKLVNTGTSDLTITYTNGYADVSYSFYNQLGQLIATIAPEGVKKLYGSGINNYTTKNDVPFITLNDYDAQGKLIKTYTADGGAKEMVYRQDGRIRFSQDADQKLSGRYSYTNYDRLGRPIECGEYQPDGSGIQFNSDMAAAANPMRDIIENISATGGLTTGTKYDVTTALFDTPDNSHGLTNYVQEHAYLGGGISMTRKYSSILNNSPNNADIVSSTWYNYNETGKTLWTIKYIKDLGYKTIDFYYDPMGRMIKKIFQKDVAPETFVHYYEYDAVTKKLWKVHTNTTDNASTRQLQATYIYYLHGSLKRVELASDLQGIDYTYTLQGALKAVNNSDKTKDPAADGSNGISTDAFGMVLDYFPGDYQNSRTSGIQPIKGVNTSGIGTDSYSGKIKAMTWFSRKPPLEVATKPGIEDPTTYVFQYDDRNQFVESTWGNAINFLNTPATFTATGLNKETIKHPTNGTPAYDANGNILYLQRTDGTGALSEKFTYNYLSNTNKLQNVVNDATGTPQTYSSYTYYNHGRLASEDKGGGNINYIKYDASGKVLIVAKNPGFTNKIVEFAYNEAGLRICKKSYNASFALSQVTYYVGDVVYTQQVTGGVPGAITAQEYQIQGKGGRIGIYYRQSNIYAYELSDHQGNVRALVAKNGSSMEVRMYSDYYPFGTTIRQYQSPEGYRYGYQGQYSEKDNETAWNAFELRMYDSKIARWLSVDPANQYWSPYIGMGNNPINGVDPDGGNFWDWLKAKFFAMSHKGDVSYTKLKKDGEYYYQVRYDITDGVGIKNFKDRGGSAGLQVALMASRMLNTIPLSPYPANLLHNPNADRIISLYHGEAEEIVKQAVTTVAKQVWRQMPDMIEINYARAVSSGIATSGETTITILLKGKDPGVYWSYTPSAGVATSVGSDWSVTVGIGKYLGEQDEMTKDVIAGYEGSVSAAAGWNFLIKGDVIGEIEMGFDDKGRPNAIMVKAGIGAGVGVATPVQVSVMGGKQQEPIKLFPLE